MGKLLNILYKVIDKFTKVNSDIFLPSPESSTETDYIPSNRSQNKRTKLQFNHKIKLVHFILQYEMCSL